MFNQMNIINQLLTMGRNPQQIVQNVIAQNPQMRVAFNQMQQSGMNTQQYVMQYAKQNNIDINPLIQILRNMGVK